MDSTAIGLPCVCILWRGGVSCPVSAAWHFCVAAHWSKYHCYKQAPSWYDLRCFKATLNPNKQTKPTETDLRCFDKLGPGNRRGIPFKIFKVKEKQPCAQITSIVISTVPLNSEDMVDGYSLNAYGWLPLWVAIWISIVKNQDGPSKQWKEGCWLVITWLYSMWFNTFKFS